MAAFDAVLVAVGNTAQRPSAANGMVRINSDIGQFEYVAENSWIPADIAASANVNTVQNLSIVAGVISWNGAAGSFANVTLSANNANVANPTSLAPGTYYLKVNQAAPLGNAVIANWGSVFQWPQGVTPNFYPPMHMPSISFRSYRME